PPRRPGRAAGGMHGMGDRRKLPPNTRLRNARRARVSPSGSGLPMSRQELAQELNDYLWNRYRIEERLDANDIGKYERGPNRWPGVRRREAFRAVLKVDNDSQLGFYVNRRERRAVSDDNCTPQDTDVFDDISSFEASGTLPLDQHLALGEGSDMRRRGLLAA